MTTRAEIEARLKAAPTAPWKAHDGVGTISDTDGIGRKRCGCGQTWCVPWDIPILYVCGARDEEMTCGEGMTDEQKELTANFIAHAPTDIRHLLDDNERLREALRALDGYLCTKSIRQGTRCPHCIAHEALEERS